MIKKIIILGVLLLALTLRLYKLDNPIADWHSWRQADTASVTDRFINNGVNLMVPTYQDVSNIPSGKENPNGYRMVEFPIYNLLHYWVYQVNPGMGIDAAGRFTSVLLSVLSVLFVYLIANKLSGFFVGFLASLFMAIIPFNIFYSRVVLPEPLMITTILGSYWFILLMAENLGLKKRVYLVLSALLFSVSLLTKPYAIFFALPHAAILIRSWAQKQLNFLDILSYALISLVPFGLWRNHILQYPEGIPASDWLYNQNGIRFRPAWVRWLFGERIGKMILGTYGTVFLMLGVIAKPKREGIAYWLWGIGILIYFSIIAGGNVQHDYYQAIIVPFICFILAKGFALMISLSRTTYSRFLTLIMGVSALGLMLSLAWYDIKGLYQINNPAIVEAGKAVDKIAPKDAKVIAPYNGDTAFLYQTHRQGWPIGYYIEDKIENGAQYYVSTSYDAEAKDLEKKYTLVEKNDRYIIIKLVK